MKGPRRYGVPNLGCFVYLVHDRTGEVAMYGLPDPVTDAGVAAAIASMDALCREGGAWRRMTYSERDAYVASLGRAGASES